MAVSPKDGDLMDDDEDYYQSDARVPHEECAVRRCDRGCKSIPEQLRHKADETQARIGDVRVARATRLLRAAADEIEFLITGVDPAKCLYCGKKATQRADHGSHREYVCGVCNKAYDILLKCPHCGCVEYDDEAMACGWDAIIGRCDSLEDDEE